jgi:hypothetical protein
MLVTRFLKIRRFDRERRGKRERFEVLGQDGIVQPAIVVQFGQERRPVDVREWLEDFRGRATRA